MFKLIKKMVKLKEGNRYYYDSSNILYSEYDEETMDMVLLFMGGGIYSYSNMTPFVYDQFVLAKSQGKFFIDHIKDNKLIEVEKIGQLSKGEVVELKKIMGL